MKLKTFQTHTFAIIEDIRAIELSFNVWASENKDIEIIRTDYFTSLRENKNGSKYEELVLLVFFNPISN